MPVTTRSKTELKPVSKEEWNAVEALLFLKRTPPMKPMTNKEWSVIEAPLNRALAANKRPHRSSASYAPGTFTDMEE